MGVGGSSKLTKEIEQGLDTKPCIHGKLLYNRASSQTCGKKMDHLLGSAKKTDSMWERKKVSLILQRIQK